MGLTLCTASDKVRDQITTAVKKTAEGVVISYGIPADRMPIVTVSPSEITPVTSEPAFAERLRKVATLTLGTDHVVTPSFLMGSEDVGLFSLDQEIPTVMFWLGAADSDKLAAGV